MDRRMWFECYYCGGKWCADNNTCINCGHPGAIMETKQQISEPLWMPPDDQRNISAITMRSFTSCSTSFPTPWEGRFEESYRRGKDEAIRAAQEWQRQLISDDDIPKPPGFFARLLEKLTWRFA